MVTAQEQRDHKVDSPEKDGKEAVGFCVQPRLLRAILAPIVQEVTQRNHRAQDQRKSEHAQGPLVAEALQAWVVISDGGSRSLVPMSANGLLQTMKFD